MESSSLVKSWLAESWRYRELVYFFAWRDIKVRYKQAALGAAWAVLQPLLGMIVFTVFFGGLARIPGDGVPYPLFAYLGLVLWTYFANVISQGGQSLISNSTLITKVYFPRIALPASSALGGLFDAAVGLSFVVVLMAWYQVLPGWSLILAPIFLVALVLLTVGVSLLLAAVNVWYRDVKHTLPLLIQLWLFASPVIYPFDYVPERYRPLMALNPLAGLVEGFRDCLLPDRWPDPGLTVFSLAATAVVFVLGVTVFRRAERSFADVI
jgi:lipopolysaccharide transport system permease protein